MIGAIIGDVVGSRFEFNNIKTKDFSLFVDRCEPTDDSVMTLAVAKALLDCEGQFDFLPEKAVNAMLNIGRCYPHAGYGGHFYRWLWMDHPQPYNSFGNGAAMRVSACAYAADTLETVKRLARDVTEVSHNHPEGIKAAEAVASAVFMARTGSTMEEIRQFIEAHYYSIDFTLDEIRPTYSFDVTCMGSVPQAFEAFFESSSFEDAIRNAISIGGDSDTIAAITGAIAGAYYPIPRSIRSQLFSFLDDTQKKIIRAFSLRYDMTPGNILREGKKRNYKVITLCGSTRFKDAFIEAQKDLTLKGNIVISVGLFGHSGDNEVFTEGVKEMLDDMHKRKIDMADEIFVINVGGYIGTSTASEIEYAESTGKPVRYLEPME